MKQWLIILALLMTTPARSADVVHLYAAGSLRDALDATRAAFTQATGIAVEAKYGPSGLLKDEIAGGANADVFASANMDHPQALARAGKSGPVVLFARNRLCALVRPGLAIDQTMLLDRMLDFFGKLLPARGEPGHAADRAGDLDGRPIQSPLGAFPQPLVAQRDRF